MVRRANGDEDRSSIRLNEGQAAVLAWIVDGCPAGVFPDGSFNHRITARALESRHLVKIEGHGSSWRATPTDRGRSWPHLGDAERVERAAHHTIAESESALDVPSPVPKVSKTPASASGNRLPRSAGHAEGKGNSMRYKVVITRVQVAERWIKATDEEDAARKIREEFEKPYAYVGHWETMASEVEIVDAAPATTPSPSILDESGAVLLSLRDAANALGVPYSALYKLTSQGAIEYTPIGSRRYIQRQALADFIEANTRSGSSLDRR